ncbi:MAG TPA: glycosyltransferase family 2 protein [Gaiellaceae bacterium]|nr:glycosyltransferase family 2 protein [Gaiellaceae bacterium]
MKFSLAMPTRDMASYVGAAARSALSQTEEEVELLVQDACSTDGTADVLTALGDPRVAVVREPDGGQADAINRGLARATGEILGWLNGDDELEPGALATVAAVFEREPSTELVYGRGAYFDGSGARLRPYDVRAFDRRLLLTRDYILQPAAFWRRSLWERVGPLDVNLTWGFDWDWFIRASRETSFRLVDVELARYGLTGENKSIAGGAERQAELAKIARRHGGRRQPTYLYWRFTLLKHRVPYVAPLEPLLWRLFPGRIMA